jgi:hypothetical protein
MGEDIVRSYLYSLYFKQMYKYIKIFVSELDKCFNIDDNFIKLEFDKIKKMIKQKKHDKSNLIYYVRNLIYKIKKYHVNYINTNLMDIINNVNYTFSN